MGSQIYADKKMQYYPTSSIETMRILCVLDSYCDINQKLSKEFEDNYSNIIREEYFSNHDKIRTASQFSSKIVIK